MKSRADAFWPLLALWLVVVVASLGWRPLLPVDETRYVGVAWEMWLRGDFLVPFKNGAPYAHKPPLLFWLIHAGWALFGVNDWWPRLVGPLLGLMCIPLLQSLARRLWPEQSAVPGLAAWLLAGSWLWLLIMTLVQFDLLLMLCTLLAMLGWWRMAEQGRFSWLPGLAIGLGILAKGPVILLHVLPVALLAPWWSSKPGPGWRWYGWLLLSVLIGAALGLAWALPAGLAGGEAYRDAIFWGQTANRVVNSFAHQQPWWWYLPLLPVLLLPWSGWPTVWRAMFSRGSWGGPAVRFVLAWVVPVLVAFSLVSGKQLKYLLPLLPGLLLLISWLLARLPARPARPWYPAALAMVAGGLLATVRFWLPADDNHFLASMNPAWSVPLLGLGPVLLLSGKVAPKTRLKQLTLVSAAVIILVQLAVLQVAAPRYDLTAISLRIAALQQAGHQVANIGTYHDQFQFPGRLKQPLVEVGMADDAPLRWAEAHPRDYLVVYRDDWPGLGTGAVFEQDYRGQDRELGLWRAADWLQVLPPGYHKRLQQKKHRESKRD